MWFKLCSHKYGLYRILKEFQSKWIARDWFKSKYYKGSVLLVVVVSFFFSHAGLGERQTINCLCLIAGLWPYSKGDCSFHMVSDLYSMHLRLWSTLELLLISHRLHRQMCTSLALRSYLICHHCEEGAEPACSALCHYFHIVLRTLVQRKQTVLLQGHLKGCNSSQKPNQTLINSILKSRNMGRKFKSLGPNLSEGPPSLHRSLLLDLLSSQPVRLKLLGMLCPDLAVLKLILIMLPFGLRSFIDLFFLSFFKSKDII